MSLARAVIVGNLTRAPESIANAKGCLLAIAVNERVKKGEEWVDHVSYFDVAVWGKQAESCTTYLDKGSPVAVDCRPRQDRWEDKESGKTRSAVRFTADNVRFLGSGNGKKPDQHTASRDEEIAF